MIQLDCTDCYGPLTITQVMPDGTSSVVGRGSDPRLLPDGVLAYVEDDGAASQRELVRVAPGGGETRTPGGAGRLPGLGGPLDFEQGPFSLDGRFQVWSMGRCIGGAEPCAMALFIDDPNGERAPARTVMMGPYDSRLRLAVRNDGGAFSGCAPFGERDYRWIWVDMSSGAQTELSVPGNCGYIDMDQERVLVVGDLGVTVIERSGARVDLPTSFYAERVLLGPCAEDVYLVGERGDTKEVQRIHVATGAVTTLATLPILGGAGAASRDVDVEDFALDHNGWLLVTTRDLADYDARRAWLVHVGGGAATISVPMPAARTFGVHLGPLTPVRR